jgi:hypothetical protein
LLRPSEWIVPHHSDSKSQNLSRCLSEQQRTSADDPPHHRSESIVPRHSDSKSQNLSRCFSEQQRARADDYPVCPGGSLAGPKARQHNNRGRVHLTAAPKTRAEGPATYQPRPKPGSPASTGVPSKLVCWGGSFARWGGVGLGWNRKRSRGLKARHKIWLQTTRGPQLPLAEPA